MGTEIALWMIDQTLKNLAGSILAEAGYSISFVNDKVLSDESQEMEDCHLLFIDGEIVRQHDEAVAAIVGNLRESGGGKVVVLSTPEFYPFIRENSFKTNRLAHHFLFYPLSSDELIANAQRYLP